MGIDPQSQCMPVVDLARTRCAQEGWMRSTEYGRCQVLNSVRKHLCSLPRSLFCQSSGVLCFWKRNMFVPFLLLEWNTWQTATYVFLLVPCGLSDTLCHGRKTRCRWRQSAALVASRWESRVHWALVLPWLYYFSSVQDPRPSGWSSHPNVPNRENPLLTCPEIGTHDDCVWLIIKINHHVGRLSSLENSGGDRSKVQMFIFTQSGQY